MILPLIAAAVLLQLPQPSWSFEDALRYVLAKRKDGKGRALHKLRIAPEERLHLLKELHRMNISAESLYPGLDGFARSLTVRAEILTEEWHSRRRPRTARAAHLGLQPICR